MASPCPPVFSSPLPTRRAFSVTVLLSACSHLTYRSHCPDCTPLHVQLLHSHHALPHRLLLRGPWPPFLVALHVTNAAVLPFHSSPPVLTFATPRRAPQRALTHGALTHAALTHADVISPPGLAPLSCLGFLLPPFPSFARTARGPLLALSCSIRPPSSSELSPGELLGRLPRPYP